MTQNQDSLIRVENSLIARFNSLLRRKKFPVPMRREFPRNSLDLLPYLASLSGSQGLNGQNSLFFPRILGISETSSLVTLPSSDESSELRSRSSGSRSARIGRRLLLTDLV